MESVNEVTLLLCIRISVVCLPIFYSSLNFGLFTKFSDLSFYHFATTGSSSPDAKADFGVLTLSILNFLTGAILQLRIEIDNLTFHEESGWWFFIRKLVCQSQNSSDEIESSSYNLKFWRFILALGLLLSLMFIFHATGGASQIRYTYVTIYAVFYGIGPCIFVSNHAGMKAMAVNTLNSLISL